MVVASENGEPLEPKRLPDQGAEGVAPPGPAQPGLLPTRLPTRLPARRTRPMAGPAKAMAVTLIVLCTVDSCVGLLGYPGRPLVEVVAPMAAVVIALGLLAIGGLEWVGAVLGLMVGARQLLRMVGPRAEAESGVSLGEYGPWIVLPFVGVILVIAVWTLRVQWRGWRQEQRRWEEQEMAGAETARGAEAVRAHLAEHDEACPGCGYNLRGLTADRCPECSGPVRLVLWRPSAAAGFYRLATVVLALVAGNGMHAAWNAARTLSRIPGISARLSGSIPPAYRVFLLLFLFDATIQIGLGVAALVILVRARKSARRIGHVTEIARAGITRRALWLCAAWLASVLGWVVAQTISDWFL